MWVRDALADALSGVTNDSDDEDRGGGDDMLGLEDNECPSDLESYDETSSNVDLDSAE